MLSRGWRALQSSAPHWSKGGSGGRGIFATTPQPKGYFDCLKKWGPKRSVGEARSDVAKHLAGGVILVSPVARVWDCRRSRRWPAGFPW